MAVLSVRLPKELEKVVPRKDRSAWVIEAIRERLRREKILAIAESAAKHSDRELEVLEEWEPATAPLPRSRKGRR